MNGVHPNDFDALVLPGGVMNPDELRMHPKAVAFVKSFFDAGKPVAAICHGPWTVIEAAQREAAKCRLGRPSKRISAMPAPIGSTGRVVDANLVTTRKPDDIPAFNRAMLDLFGRLAQKHSGQKGATN